MHPIRTQAASRGNPLTVRFLLWKAWIGRANTAYLTFERLHMLEETYPLTLQWCDSRIAKTMADVAYATDTLLYRSRRSRPLTLTKAARAFRRSVVVPDRVIKRSGADVLHTIEYFPINKVSIPIAFEFDFFAFGLRGDRAAVERLIYVPEWMIERSAVICVRHELSLEAFKEKFPRFSHKAMVVPHYLPGLDPVSEEEVSKKFERLERKRIELLFVGNQARLKALPEVVRAWELLRQSYGDRARLTVVSRFQDGPVELPADVHVLSNLPSADVYRLMRQAHVFIMPSKREATGNVLWEAMANGCAIVCARVSPQKELFEQFGTAVDPTDPEDIATGLAQLLDDPASCVTAAHNARRTFIDKYHHSVVGSLYLEAWRRAKAIGPHR